MFVFPVGAAGALGMVLTRSRRRAHRALADVKIQVRIGRDGRPPGAGASFA